ncbi:MAG: hypothetical protein VB084_13550 [Syntrophomonadaceae bacterium]|nr:hypothetical protein [Syntrophomonadaceae bacterium]
MQKIKRELLGDLFKNEMTTDGTYRVICKKKLFQKWINQATNKYEKILAHNDFKEDFHNNLFEVICKTIMFYTFSQDEQEEIEIWKLIKENFLKNADDKSNEMHQYAGLFPYIKKIIDKSSILASPEGKIKRVGRQNIYVQINEVNFDLIEEYNISNKNEEENNCLQNDFIKYFIKFNDYTEDEKIVLKMLNKYKTKAEISKILDKPSVWIYNRCRDIKYKVIKGFFEELGYNLKGKTRKEIDDIFIQWYGNQYKSDKEFNAVEESTKQKEKNENYKKYLKSFIDENTYVYKLNISGVKEKYLKEKDPCFIKKIPKTNIKKKDRFFYLVPDGGLYDTDDINKINDSLIFAKNNDY